MRDFTGTTEHKRQLTLIRDPSKRETDKDGEVMAPRKKRVAAYARVSTEQDAQQSSYDAQISYYSEYIQKNLAWEFVGVYADDGITGTSYKRRDGFNRMITDALNDKIDLILTKSISRFARNTVDALTVTRQLKSKGIEVYFEKENISSMDSTAELIFTIMSSIAQEESRSISENVRWGLQRRMEAGQVVLPWNVFLGFERGPDGLPKIVEEEAKIVQKIYCDYLHGGTLRGIAKDLGAKGVASPSGNDHWSPESVRNILTNEKYMGDALLGKTYIVDFLTKEKRINNGERKQWYIRDSHDAIVTGEAFKRVQDELKRRSKFSGRYYYGSSLNAKTYCGLCGQVYGFRKWDEEKENHVNRWVCPSCYNAGKFPKSMMLREFQVKKAFLVAINRFVADYSWSPEKCEQMIVAALEKADGALPENTTRKKLHDAIYSFHPEVTEFDEHTWHLLLEHVKVMPDKTFVFRFRNGRKEIVEYV